MTDTQARFAALPDDAIVDALIYDAAEVNGEPFQRRVTAYVRDLPQNPDKGPTGAGNVAWFKERDAVDV